MPPVAMRAQKNPLRPTSGILSSLANIVWGETPIEEMQTSLEGALSPLAMVNVFPKHLQKLFSQELAENILRKLSGTPKIAQAAADMVTSPRHQAITSTLTNLGHTDPYENILGIYKPGSYDLMRDTLARKPVSYDPLAKHSTMIANASDEELARYARVFGGEIGVANRLENEPIAEIYKTIRHELSHAADNLADKKVGPGFALRGEDPRYWVNLSEVRARASEPNYVRDMTGRADVDYNFPLGLPGERPHRPTLAKKVIDEVNRGYDIGTRKVGFPRVTTEDQYKKGIDEINEELSQTVSHYFGKNYEMIKQYHPNRYKTIEHGSRLEIPRPDISPFKPNKYPWERLIKDSTIVENSGLSGPSARAYEDLLRRLRGSASSEKVPDILERLKPILSEKPYGIDVFDTAKTLGITPQELATHFEQLEQQGLGRIIQPSTGGKISKYRGKFPKTSEGFEIFGFKPNRPTE